MIPDDHDICAATDHRHWTYSVHFCPHRQQLSLARSAWLEQGTRDDPTEHHVESIALGPFDGWEAVTIQIVEWLESDGDEVWGTPPRPPGS